MKKLILASSSIHRKKLLRQLKLKFTVIKPNIDESRKKGEEINKFIKRLSYEKAMKVAANKTDAIVIGSDEVALIGGKVLGKPKTVNNAKKTIKADIEGKKQREDEIADLKGKGLVSLKGDLMNELRKRTELMEVLTEVPPLEESTESSKDDSKDKQS